MSFLVKKADGSCGPYQAAGLGPNSEYVMLRQGVGKGGRNLPAEVTDLQKALNKLPAAKGGTTTAISENGVVDDDLIQAILLFKSVNVPEDKQPLMKHPMRATILLNELLLADKQLVKSNSEILPKLRSLIQDAEDCIKAALMNIDLANASQMATLPGSAPGAGMRLLKRHFHIDQMPNQRQAMDFVSLIYGRMRQVFQRPGNLWGSFVLDFDPTPPQAGWLAFTTAGGFFRAGEFDGTRRSDTIYLCELLRLSTREGAIQTIVHELAHFCGPKDGEIIGDIAYGMPDAPKMQRLMPYQRLHNAESYSNFAFECKYGRDAGAMV